MKAYTDLKQSKILSEILPIESAGHHYVRKVTDFAGNTVDGKWSVPKYGNPNGKYANYIVQNFTSYEILPCWSLAALLSVLPRFIEFDTHYTFLLIYPTQNLGWVVEYSNHKDIIDFSINNKNLIDACYEMIIKLNELKLL